MQLYASMPRRPGWPESLLVAILALAGAGCGGDSTAGADGTFTLSGVVTAGANSVVDSDVNDPRAPYVDNSDFSTPQHIPNPVVVGGYVNVAFFGAPGRSLTRGDKRDFFQATLEAGQTIVLSISEPSISQIGFPSADLDLYLYRAGDPTLIDSSERFGTGTEVLNVVDDGDYIIEVRADRGASGYTLRLGRDRLGLTETAGPRLSDEFVPGEALARMDPTEQRGGRLTKLPKGFKTKKRLSNGVVLLGLEEAVADGLDAIKEHTRDRKARRKLATLRAIKELRRAGGVVWAEPNYIRQASLVPSDAYLPRQWNYEMIGLARAWDITTGSSTVSVAVIDSGVLTGHPDLAGKLVSGFDFVSDPANAGDGDGIDAIPVDPGHPGAGGGIFHGTHVAGSIAAATDNNIGVAGVGWATMIMPLRVLGLNGATSYDVCQALRYAAGLPNDSGSVPARPAAVANMSFGGSAYSRTEQDCISAVRQAGVALVAAAGNNGDDRPLYPAAYDGVVSVGAVDMARDRAWYSNFGATLDVVAPGGDTRVDIDGDGDPDGVLGAAGDMSTGPLRYTYAYYMGTSMAAPHVSGVYALMIATYPELTPSVFDELLRSGALTEDLGEHGWDQSFGYGLIDAPRAVTAALAAGGGDPLVSGSYAMASPAGLNFGQTVVELRLAVSNAGEGELSIDAPSNDADGWLSVRSASVDADGLGSYSVSVDRSGLSAGTYTARLNFTTSANVLSVPVIMQVAAQGVDTQADAGFQYVILVRTGNDRPSRSVGVEVDRGQYYFQLTDVPPGEYEVYAGSDLDGDGSICERGESCGAYNTLARPVTVQVPGGGLEQIQFVTAFGRTLGVADAQNMAAVSEGGRRDIGGIALGTGAGD